ncbi:MAG: AMP-binding protein [Myxococcota bacterium]|nr:AMP-binding protein [Myxococcota bacterium]
MKYPHPLATSAQARPSHPALATETGTLSYAELAAEVALRAGGYAGHGVGRGDRVGILASYDTDWVIAFHAVGWLGAVAVPLSPKLSAEEMLTRVRAAQIQYLIVDEHVQTITEVCPCPRIGVRETAAAKSPELWAGDEARAVILTSGTTGTAKSVVLTTDQWFFSAMGSSIRLGHHLDDCWLAALPFHHVGGLSILVRAALLGTTVRLAWPFEPKKIVQALESESITQVSLVPEMLTRLLNEDNGAKSLSTLRVILLGGDACPEDLRLKAEELSLPVALTWGMSEASSQIATRLPGDLEARPDVGTPLPFVRVDVGPGDERLIVRGPIIGGDVLVTTDVGAIDERGRVRVFGRADDIFISGGENIAPIRVEKALCQHPCVTSAAVVDVPCERWGARPLAFVVCDYELDPRELTLFLRGHLSGYELPDTIVSCERLPVRGIGKLDRATLRELGRGLAAGTKVEVLDGAQELLGNITWLKRLKVDDGVDELAGAAQLPVITHHPVSKGDGGFPNGRNGQLDGEALTKSHGLGVIGLGMNQRHAPAATLEDVGDATAGGHQELFEGGMAVLVNATEEGNAGSVDLVESDSNYVFKSHRCSREESEG